MDYGRNYGVLYHINGWIDVLPMFWDNGISMADSYMSGRNRNLFTYRNNGFFGYIDGLNIALQYQGKMLIIINQVLVPLKKIMVTATVYPLFIILILD
ncbi:MAG: porin [Arsenophonus endosymbiont of Dermacentor nuttalli]